MSKKTTTKDCDIFTRKRGSKKTKTDITSELHEEANASGMADLAAVLAELKSLHSEFGSFESKLDSIDARLGKVASSVAALENNMTEVKRDIASTATRMEEAENRIMSTEEHLDKNQTELTNAMKRIAYLESKTDDLENRSRRKNLRPFGLREGAEGNQPLLEFIQNMLPRWLELDTGKTFTLERVHRTLAPPKPNQDRAVIIRFLKFQDREFVFRYIKQRNIMCEGNRLFFAQDLSAETMRQRHEFNTIRKVFVDKGIFHRFQLNPCKIRILHNGKIHLFSSPKEAEDFHRGHV